jgi:pilus assembly protein CpaB
VLQNILVLSAGQTLQPESRGQAINTPVVTLLVTPAQAETLTLAGNEGRIQLVLRNGNDQLTQNTPGRDITELYGARSNIKPVVEKKPPVPKLQTVSLAPPLTPSLPVTVNEEIIVIRGNLKTVEVVGVKKLTEGTN